MYFVLGKNLVYINIVADMRPPKDDFVLFLIFALCYLSLKQALVRIFLLRQMSNEFVIIAAVLLIVE